MQRTDTYRVTDESGRYGPCFVVRKRERASAGGYVWEWVAWSRTRAEAESHARSFGTLEGDHAARASIAALSGTKRRRVAK